MFQKKPCNSFACYENNDFDLSFSRHKLITRELFSSTHAWKEFMVRNLQKPKSLKAETDFICDSILKLGILCSETDKSWHVWRSLFENCVVLSFDDILVYNTYFDVYLKSLKQVQHILRNKCLVIDQIKNMFFLYDTGFLVSVLSIQEQQDMSQRVARNNCKCESYKPEIWR